MTENQILATVNGVKITNEDVDLFLRRMDQQRAAQFNTEQGRQRILEELINQKLLFADAVDNEIDKDKEFQDEMQKIKNDVLTQYAMNKLMVNVKVDPEEVKEYYETNKEHFVHPESVKASHILVDTEESAKDVLKKIEEGMPFEKAADTYSKCPEKNGGDLGYFSRGKMVQEFEDVVFNMKVGEISKPVKTQFGYHIIKLVDKIKPAPATFDEVKEQLTKQLAERKQSQTYLQKIEELKERYDVDRKE